MLLYLDLGEWDGVSDQETHFSVFSAWGHLLGSPTPYINYRVKKNYWPSNMFEQPYYPKDQDNGESDGEEDDNKRSNFRSI